MTEEIRKQLIEWAAVYNDPLYFTEDPISFPRRMAADSRRNLKDVEIAAVFAAHFAWGRRAMIVRDLDRLFTEMDYRPLDYVMAGDWRDGNSSIHRTIKWSDVAAICSRLKLFYDKHDSMEMLSNQQIRQEIYGQKPDLKAPCKKINMLRRWMVRADGKVDLGLWTHSDPADLLIPLDVHVHAVATSIGITKRSQKDIVTVREITAALSEVFPGDPCLGDFALFGYGVSNKSVSLPNNE